VKIEAGKTYVDGVGAILGPMEPTGRSPYSWRGNLIPGGSEGAAVGFDTYMDDGTFCQGDTCKYDLVAEYVEPIVAQPRTPNQMRRIDEIPVLIARLEAERAAIQAACNHKLPQPITFSCIDRFETDCPECGQHNVYYREIK
jgi:hypothetical protein